MKKTCLNYENLINTYDTKYIDLLSTEEQETLKKISEAFQDKKLIKRIKNAKIVLLKLIYNHFHKSIPDIEYVVGPYTFTHSYSKKYNMNVYIFGEDHMTNNDCKNMIDYDKNKSVISISDYLVEIIKNTDKFFDIYLEQPATYYNKENVKHNRKIINSPYYNKPNINVEFDKLFDKLKICMYPFEREKNEMCKISRVHYIDIRKTIITETYLPVIKYSIEFLQKNYYNMNFARLEYKKILNKKPKELLMYMIEHASKDKDSYQYKLHKQLNKTFLDKNVLIDTVYNFYEKRLELMYKNCKSAEDILDEELIDYMKLEHILIYPIFVEYVIVLASILVDIYTLSRIFRDFNVDKNKNLDQPKNPKNIIIYSGNRHSDSYRHFLNLNSFEILQQRKTINKNAIHCLDMSNIKI